MLEKIGDEIHFIEKETVMGEISPKVFLRKKSLRLACLVFVF
jgi:hypothetical protein